MEAGSAHDPALPRAREEPRPVEAGDTCSPVLSRAADGCAVVSRPPLRWGGGGEPGLLFLSWGEFQGRVHVAVRLFRVGCVGVRVGGDRFPPFREGGNRDSLARDPREIIRDPFALGRPLCA
ncbi:hypothetical protein GCM10023094_32100 [Rhodococcus olei]|uniref:Uncharacterized protein n=1 Tax=Rhodococcus olei TaxID=2161675 RepID=A0ABP8P6Q1_9NOCA